MANKRITEFSGLTSFNADAVLPIVQDGINYKITTADLLAGSGGISNLQSVLEEGSEAMISNPFSVTVNQGNQYGSLSIDAGTIVIGTTFQGENDTLQSSFYSIEGATGLQQTKNGLQTVIGFEDPIETATLLFPAKPEGEYTIATLDDISGGSGLQSVLEAGSGADLTGNGKFLSVSLEPNNLYFIERNLNNTLSAGISIVDLNPRLSANNFNSGNARTNVIVLPPDGSNDNVEFIFPTDKSTGTYTIATRDDITGGGNSGLEVVTEDDNTGYRLSGTDPENYGPIGGNAVDLSFSFSPSEDLGATGFQSFAQGYNAKATGGNSIAMGSGCESTDASAVAIGFQSKATGYVSVAIGNYAEASEFASTAMGDNTKAEGFASFAVGSGAQAGSSYSFSQGYNTKSLAEHAVSMISGAEASGDRSVAIGDSTQASGYYSIAMGNSSISSNYSTVAIGNRNEAIGNQAWAIGPYGNISNASNSVTIGYSNQADINSEIVIGAYSEIFTGTSELSTSEWFSGDTIFRIGVGDGLGTTPETNRADAFRVYKGGYATLPKSTVESITEAGDKAVITKEWFDANSSGVSFNKLTDPTNIDTLPAGKYMPADTLDIDDVTYYNENTGNDDGLSTLFFNIQVNEILIEIEIVIEQVDDNTTRKIIKQTISDASESNMFFRQFSELHYIDSDDTYRYGRFYFQPLTLFKNYGSYYNTDNTIAAQSLLLENSSSKFVINDGGDHVFNLFNDENDGGTKDIYYRGAIDNGNKQGLLYLTPGNGFQLTTSDNNLSSPSVGFAGSNTTNEITVYGNLVGDVDLSSLNDGTDRNVYPQTGWVQDYIGNYKIYSVLLNQSNTDNPIAYPLQNTFPDEFTITRMGVGNYRITSDLISTWNIEKTVVFVGQGNVNGDLRIQYSLDLVNGYIDLYTQSGGYLSPWTNYDDLLAYCPFEIKVYN